MKKVFLTLMLLGGFTMMYASTGDVVSPKKEESKDKKEPKSRVSCSVEVGGITYTTSAGGWFTSPERAAEKCVAKLEAIVANTQE